MLTKRPYGLQSEESPQRHVIINIWLIAWTIAVRGTCLRLFVTMIYMEFYLFLTNEDVPLKNVWLNFPMSLKQSIWNTQSVLSIKDLPITQSRRGSPHFLLSFGPVTLFSTGTNWVRLQNPTFATTLLLLMARKVSARILSML